MSERLYKAAVTTILTLAGWTVAALLLPLLLMHSIIVTRDPRAAWRRTTEILD